MSARDATTVTVFVAESFAAFTSPVSVTVATFVSVPVVGALTVIVTTQTPPPEMLGLVHVRGGFVHPGADTNVPFPMSSVRVTDAEASGSLFVTVIV